MRIANPLIFRTNHLLKQAGFLASIREQIGTRKPKMMVFFGEHAPFEPTKEAARLMEQRFNPQDVVFIEIPASHTPLGQSLEAYDFLHDKTTRLANGEKVVAELSPEENLEFGRQLMFSMQLITSQIEELLAIYNAGFKKGNGQAGKRIREKLISNIRSAMGDRFTMFQRDLERLRPWQEFFPPLELICFELAKDYPGAYFLTLHSQIIGREIYQMDLPAQSANCTLAANDINHIAHQAIAARQRGSDQWYVNRYDPPSQLMRAILPLHDFNEKVLFTYFELPQDLLRSSPPERETFCMAVIGALLLPNPFDIDLKDLCNDWDMDYFRQSPESESQEHAHIAGEFIAEALSSLD
ncbi:MAG: hypothetical protein WC890_03110 [Candidatus Margulisiibacteriota bacterium]